MFSVLPPPHSAARATTLVSTIQQLCTLDSTLWPRSTVTLWHITTIVPLVLVRTTYDQQHLGLSRYMGCTVCNIWRCCLRNVACAHVYQQRRYGCCSRCCWLSKFAKRSVVHARVTAANSSKQLKTCVYEGCVTGQ
jgi:hypothetical protein